LVTTAGRYRLPCASSRTAVPAPAPAPVRSSRSESAHGSDNRFWLWTFQGGCAVYAVPCVQVRSVARRPRDFVPVVDHLLVLHRNGVVHGDVRCDNIAVGSHLVDFGHCRDARVVDGPGGGGASAALTSAMWNDWRALSAVLFRHHEFQLPPAPEREQNAHLLPWWRRWWIAVATAAVAHRRPQIGQAEPCETPAQPAWLAHQKLRVRMDALKSFGARAAPRPGLPDIEAHATDLTDFLEAAESARWTVKPVRTESFCYAD
jgi:hypothetical protein